MIIYIEKQALKYSLSEHILSKYENPKIILIENYKNIFDKKIGFPTEKSIIIACIKNNGITEVPINYSKTEKSFFFKSSLNCVFDCKYCYLKGAFKNNFLVFFVNYEDIKKSIENKIKEIRSSGYKKEILFYASDYSDNLATEDITNFHKEFIPFFETFDNVKLETRTKSSNIKSLLKLGFIPKNTEIAFSINPDIIITKYEKYSSNLDNRIKAINNLLDKGFKVGLRFLPLLPINNWEQEYSVLLDRIASEINLNKINSISIGSLLYTKDDYNKIIKKERETDVLYLLEDFGDGYYRMGEKFRKSVYELFERKIGATFKCLDNI